MGYLPPARVAGITAALVVLLSACGTMRDGRAWGESATLTPGWDRIGAAARDAALDPWTWVPAVGAAVFQIDDWDRRVSDWAREEQPVFGADAEDVSDELRALCADAWKVTLVLTPSGDEPLPWLRYKAQGYLVEWGAGVVAGAATDVAKQSADRERPDGSNTRSFWSGHTQSAATSATLASRNLDAIDMPRGVRTGLKGALVLAVAGTGWARVEAGKHYPSDVLFGAAAGRFLAAFVHDAFLGRESAVQVEAHVEPESGAVALGVSWSF